MWAPFPLQFDPSFLWHIIGSGYYPYYVSSNYRLPVHPEEPLTLPIEFHLGLYQAKSAPQSQKIIMLRSETTPDAPEADSPNILGDLDFSSLMNVEVVNESSNDGTQLQPGFPQQTGESVGQGSSQQRDQQQQDQQQQQQDQQQQDQHQQQQDQQQQDQHQQQQQPSTLGHSSTMPFAYGPQHLPRSSGEMDRNIPVQQPANQAYDPSGMSYMVYGGQQYYIPVPPQFVPHQQSTATTMHPPPQLNAGFPMENANQYVHIAISNHFILDVVVKAVQHGLLQNLLPQQQSQVPPNDQAYHPPTDPISPSNN